MFKGGLFADPLKDLREMWELAQKFWKQFEDGWNWLIGIRNEWEQIFFKVVEKWKADFFNWWEEQKFLYVKLGTSIGTWLLDGLKSMACAVTRTARSRLKAVRSSCKVAKAT